MGFAMRGGLNAFQGQTGVELEQVVKTVSACMDQVAAVRQDRIGLVGVRMGNVSIVRRPPTAADRTSRPNGQLQPYLEWMTDRKVWGKKPTINM